MTVSECSVILCSWSCCLHLLYRNHFICPLYLSYTTIPYIIVYHILQDCRQCHWRCDSCHGPGSHQCASCSHPLMYHYTLLSIIFYRTVDNATGDVTPAMDPALTSVPAVLILSCTTKPCIPVFHVAKKDRTRQAVATAIPTKVTVYQSIPCILWWWFFTFPFCKFLLD